MNKVLIVEDDASILLGLASAFQDDGFQTEVARTGPEGLQKALEGHPDVILLDLMLPDMSGFEVCKRIRDHHLPCKVIMLTARVEENDRVLGFELGADDYVTKPFSVRELLARVRAHLRAVPGTAASREPATPADELDRYRFGDVLVDFKRHEVFRSGKPRRLTNREFRLLEYFVRHPGEVFSRDHLLEEAWDYAGDETTRTVDNHILRLRKHIEPDPQNPRHIKTVRGAGYLFDPRPESEVSGAVE